MSGTSGAGLLTTRMYEYEPALMFIVFCFSAKAKANVSVSEIKYVFNITRRRQCANVNTNVMIAFVC